MTYFYFLLLRFGSLLFSALLVSSCTFEKTVLRCFSFEQASSYFQSLGTEDVATLEELEVECSETDQNTTFSIPSSNLNAISIHRCGGRTSNLEIPTSQLRLVNLSNNDITSLRWNVMSNGVAEVLDLRHNPLSCDICENLWLYEHKSRSQKGSYWDLHFIVGLPKQILIDEEFLQCNFTHCSHEEVQAQPLTSKLQLGNNAHLRCNVVGVNSSSDDDSRMSGSKQFIWPLRDELEEDNTTSLIMEETWDANLGTMDLNITNLTSHELGYVACICQHCRYRPAFDVLELRFDTDLSASLKEEGHDNHLIIHGYPLDDLNITITRIADNETETSLLTKKKISFFNDSLLFRLQQDHSHFFVRYYSLIIQECILCPPRLSSHIDGDYTIEICRISVGDCAIAKGYLDHPNYESVSKIPESKDRRGQHLLLITIFLILLIIGLLIALSKTHIKHRLLKKGWELKRRRTSRNTDRTEETSIRLDDYSASSSLTYIVQHVPLIDKEFLHVKEKIGKGAFGEVHCADWIEKERTVVVAMKMLHGVQLDSELDKEAALLSQLDHPNIVKLYGISRWDNQIALVMEMMNLGDLKNYVRQRMPRCDNYSQFPAPLLTTELLNIAAQIAAGLCYLTSQQIVHRDLAARNCLVQGESDMKVCTAAFRKPIAVKISDFGMSRRLYSDGEYYKMQNGKTVLPVRWLPPECLSSGKFTHQSDMWSFGMCLFELFSYGDVPFGDLSNNEVLTAVMSGMKPQLPSSFPEPINNLISNCWKHEPSERITAEEALNRLQIIQ